jgi:hypothetical protein
MRLDFGLNAYLRTQKTTSEKLVMLRANQHYTFTVSFKAPSSHVAALHGCPGKASNRYGSGWLEVWVKPNNYPEYICV